MIDKVIKALGVTIKIAKRRLLSRHYDDFEIARGTNVCIHKNNYTSTTELTMSAGTLMTGQHSATAELSTEQVKSLIAALSECVEAAEGKKERT